MSSLPAVFPLIPSTAQGPDEKELNGGLFEAKCGLGGEGGLGKLHTGDE